MSERMQFMSRLLAGERMTDLCREYEISRKTGYKFKKRYEEFGPAGLFDESRRPRRSPSRIPDEVRALFVDARRRHPTWGPRKLRKIVGDAHPGVKMPALSTIHHILAAEGLTRPMRRKRRTMPYTQPLAHARAPNDVWCIDFKGQFRLGNGCYCYPLTITDAHSRYLLCCEALESTKGGPAKLAVRATFERYGLPANLRSDNGSPFASTGAFGLSRLSAWWTALGIQHERIQPSHPEQNGRHERMHRTLKAETTRPPGGNLLAQQERFDAFREEFNELRPHEALDDEVPASAYQASNNLYDESLLEGRYPLHDIVLRVSDAGHVHPPLRSGLPRQVYVGGPLAGLWVGLRELDESWLVTLGSRDLGHIQPGQTTVEPL